MPFPFNTALSQEELTYRQRVLESEIGRDVVQRFKEISPNLCNVPRAKRRIQNLKDLGFNTKILIKANPKILDRKSKTVRRNFVLISIWLRLLDCDIDIHKLFISRAQLWSVGPRKMHVICLLALHINNKVTAGRLCNMFSENLEEILCTYIDNQTSSFEKLFYQVRNGVNGICTNWTKEIKLKYISVHRDKLPPSVCKKYFE